MEPPQEVVDYFRTCLEKRAELERAKLQDIQNAIDVWEQNDKELPDDKHIDDAYRAGLNTLHAKCAYTVLDPSKKTDEDIRNFIRRIQNELSSFVILKY